MLLPIMILSVFLIVACGDGGENGDVLTGTAAAGAPIVGTINVRGANGVTSFSAIGSDGSFTVDVSALTAPFVIWAEGTAYGSTVKLYSTIETIGHANVTPAINAIMAMALQQDPAGYFESNPGAAPPDQQELDEAQQTIVDLLSSVFATLGMPPDFDLMNGEFTANGTGMDAILDGVGFLVGGTGNTVTVVDNNTQTTLFQQNITTGTVTTSLPPGDVDTIIQEGITLIDELRQIFDPLEDLYAVTKPTLAQLQQTFLPYMAVDYLDNGKNRDEDLNSWADVFDRSGPPVGFKIDCIRIIRHMGDIQCNGVTVSEKGANHDGVWGVVQGFEPNGDTICFVTGFVQAATGADWQWYGNRVPFPGGGNVSPKSIMNVDLRNNTTTYYSGLDFWINDRGNLAQTRFGITQVVIANGGLPFDLLMSRRDGGLSTEYEITNVTNLDGNFCMLTESEGLNIDNLVIDPHDPLSEFIFVGLDNTGNPQHVWLRFPGVKPNKTSQLDESYFPAITQPAPGTWTPDTLGIPGNVTVSWTNPFGQKPGYISLSWANNTNWTSMDADNPNNLDPAYDPFAWTTYTFETGATTVLPPLTYVNISAEGYEDDGITYTAEYRYNNS